MRLIPSFQCAILATSSAFAFSLSHAAEGIDSEWTHVAQADLQLMGDYEGEFQGAPKNHYFDYNRPLAAQVINVRNGEYLIKFNQQHDSRADLYFEGMGKLDGDVIRFTGDACRGEITADCMVGSGTRDGQEVSFSLKRVQRLSPTLGAKPPEGAVVLFDGTNFDQWKHGNGSPVTWHLLPGGVMEVRSAKSEEDRKNKIGGDIETRQSFGDCRVHLEFRYPVEPGKQGQGRGNSGFFFQRSYEVQVLNSYGLNGLWNECGALYKLAPPKVNAARPPMQWQTYDVDYRASVWKDGKKVSSPVITVRLNGVLVQNQEEIIHVTAHAFAERQNEPREAGPIRLQDHNNAIQFRNIWVLPGAK